MASLLNFPVEILGQIIDETAPESIESFSQCCWRIHDLAEKALEQHNVNTEKWKTVNFNVDYGIALPDDGPDQYPKLINPHQFIEDIVRDPRIALYPKTVILGNWGEGDKLRGQESHTAMMIFLGTRPMNELEGPYRNILGDFVGVEEAGNSSATIPLLLTTLPNLKSFETSDQFRGGLYFHDTMDIIIDQIHKPSLGLKGFSAFSKLSKVDMTTAWDRQYNDDFNLLMLLASIPSIKTLRVQFIVRRLAPARSKYQCHKAMGLGVKNIEIIGSAANPQYMRKLIESVEALESFRYRYNPTVAVLSALRADEEIPWTPWGINQALQRHARHSLKYLELVDEAQRAWLEFTEAPLNGTRAHQRLAYLFRDGDTAFDQGREIGSLRDFRVLIKIRLDYTVFIACRGYSIRETRRLVDWLPASIEELELAGTIPLRYAVQMFGGMGTLKKAMLPKLGKITFEGRNPLDNATKAVCEDAGVALAVVECFGTVAGISG
ncbi:hypothetical protein MMC28_007261 [Mycoblastus sanguinarius]|nr:hypothetical protein [Mycoblastus sanguinarius]